MRIPGNTLILVITVVVIIALGELTTHILSPVSEFGCRLGRRKWNGDYRKSVFTPCIEAVCAGIPAKINSLDLRNREPDLRKGEGVSRILVFGNPFTYGGGLPTEQALPSQLEGLLNREEGGAWRFEVVNLGVSRMNTFQKVICALNYGLRFDPDVIIIV